MLSKIPLVMDLLDTYPDTKISDHVNSKMIEMYNAFSAGNNVNYSDDDICDYIKFINMSCMDINCYKHVASYINKNNIHVFDHLFDIYDILYELFPLLSYDTVSYHPIFNDVNHKEIKNRWIVHNITWIKRYNTELLEPYVKFKTLSAKYYVVGETVYSDHKKINPRLRESLTILYELERICSNGHLDLVKYMFNMLDDIYGDDLMDACVNSYYTFIEIFCNAICVACKNNHLEIVKYIVNFFKSKNSLHLTKKGDQYSSSFWMNYSINNIEIVKYLLTDNDLKPYVIMDVKLNLFKAAKNGNVEVVDFLIKLGGDINDEFKPKEGDFIFQSDLFMSKSENIEKIDLLAVTSFYGHIEVVKYLIDNGLDVDKYGKKSIIYASINTHTEIMKCITNKIMNIIGDNTDEKDDFINMLLKTENKEIINHVEKNYPFDHIVSYTKSVDVLLTSAYNGGQIEFVEKFYRTIAFNITQLVSEKIISIINNNVENNCIKFISFVIENNVSIECTKTVIDTCVMKGYIDLLFLINNTFKLTNEEIVKCIKYSSFEESSIRLFRDMYDKKIFEDPNLKNLVSIAVNKEYIKLIKFIYESAIIHLIPIEKTIVLSLNILISEACRINNIEIIKYLLFINEDINHNNENMLRIIIERCRSFEIIKHMLSNGLKVSLLFENLCRNIRTCDSELFEKTIKYLYDEKLVNINSKLSKMMFISMCDNNNKVKLIEYMLNKEIKLDESINRALGEAVKANNEKIVKLITDDLYHVTFIKNCSKFLIAACNNRNFDIVKMLAKYADVNEHDGLALTYACVNGSLEIVVYLCENGIDFKLYGNKVLRTSAKYGHVDIVKYLVEKGADTNVIDKKYYDKYVERYLLEVGVNIKFDKVPIKLDDVDSDGDDYYSEDDEYDSD